MKDTDLAWAAGIIDGEGHIGMTLSKVGVNRRRTPSVQVRISVRMTCERTIRKLYELFGGTFKLSLPKNPERHKLVYEWFIGDLDTFDVLCDLLPYLVTKQDQAQLVIEYRNECCPSGHRGRGYLCSVGLVKRRLEFFHTMAELNRRGP